MDVPEETTDRRHAALHDGLWAVGHRLPDALLLLVAAGGGVAVLLAVLNVPVLWLLLGLMPLSFVTALLLAFSR